MSSDHNISTDSCRIPVSGEEDVGGNWLSDFDRLDLISLVAAVIFAGAAIFLVVVQILTVEPEDARADRQAVISSIVNPDLDKKIQLAKELLTAGNFGKSEILIKSLINDFPYEGAPYMLLGDFYMRNQDPLAALVEYRKGVDLNPDYLDKKTEVFQGKQVKVTLAEAKRMILDGLAKNPADAELLNYRVVLYYMQRKVAGSCG
ncbi:MAG: hypothetical protein KKB30_16425 [Proteobacteria bacterium]|nr:hypothetical protein [Pseudomonadota bacterium]MBU1716497.1 hypothetical protein [Pseudomonadota bacterium]